MPTSYGRIGQKYHFFVDFYVKIRYINSMNNKTKDKNTMKENISIFFGVVFIMSMVAATGAVESDQYLLGAVMALLGITTGLITIMLGNK